MKAKSRVHFTGIFFIIVVIASGQIQVYAWCPATHIYIADEVFPDRDRKVDLWYGSIAPDLVAWVSHPRKWPTSFRDTHYNYIDLRGHATNPQTVAFAAGWLTHNEEWGADYYAHIEDPFGVRRGYVVRRARELHREFPDLRQEFAHWVVEIAVDLLLKNNVDHTLGKKLLTAAVFRSRLDQLLLSKVLIGEEDRTDWITLASAETAYRMLLIRYARALALPSPGDEQAIVELGVQLAGEVYGIEVTAEKLFEILRFAMGLCEGDYEEVLYHTIYGITARIHMQP